MKLLHVSDLRIGAAFPEAYRRAEALREARLEAVRSLLGLAASEGVECILLAGNTLADNRLAHRDLMELLSILGTSPCPVGLLPGLTDPFTADSPYRQRPDLFPAPLHVLSERRPWTVGNTTIYPEPVLHRNVAGPLFAGVPPEGLGVACRPPGEALPELAYLAMGGSLTPASEGTARWPGTPEVLQAGLEPGAALVVTLTPGKPARVRPKPIGQLSWLSWSRTVTDPGALAAELEGLENPLTTLLDLTLEGSLSQDDWITLLDLLESRRGRFHDLRVERKVQLREEQRLYRNPLLAGVADRLLTLAAQTDGDSPEIARHALVRLSRLVAQAPSEDLS